MYHCTMWCRSYLVLETLIDGSMIWSHFFIICLIFKSRLYWLIGMRRLLYNMQNFCLLWNLGRNSMVPRLEKFDISQCFFFLLDLPLSGVWSFLTGVFVYVIFSGVFLVISIDKFLWRKNRYRYPDQL